MFQRSLQLAHDVGDPQAKAAVLNSIGALLAISSGPATALETFRQALELARAIGSPVDEARALEGMARVLAGTGDRSPALANLRVAVAIYRQIGAAEAVPADAFLAELDGDDADAADTEDSTAR